MKEQYIGSLFHTGTYPSIHVNASDANSWRSYRGRWRLYCIFCLLLLLTFFWVTSAFAEASYPDLRDAHDPELQKAMNKALGPSHTEFWSGVHKKEFGFVVADVTDLHKPHVASYNPNLMLYAASLKSAQNCDRAGHIRGDRAGCNQNWIRKSGTSSFE